MTTEAPLRRSSRAPPSKQAAPKPPSKAVPQKAAAKPNAQSSRSPSPPPKRAKKQAAEKEKPATENTDLAVPARPVKKRKSLTPIPQAKPYFNPLPSLPDNKRPGLQVFAWGAGNFGQFGMGPDVLGELDKPKKHAWVEEQMEDGTFGEDNAGLEMVAAGGMHSLFVDEKGTVWSCGVNDDAALGRVTEGVPDPDSTLTNVPHPIEALVDEKFRAVQVATGDSICVAVNEHGDLRAWGSFRADEGSLGFSETTRHQFTPVSVPMELINKPGDYEKVSTVAAGSNHVLVLTTHGHILSWGSGQQNQLGRKVLERHQMKGTNPQKIVLGKHRSLKAVVIGAGVYHSFAVDEAGTVWGWGLNSMGQLGTGLDTKEDETVPLPKVVRGLSKDELGGDTVIQISGGNHHTLFLTSGGKVYACGRANSSQLGLAEDDEAWESKPVADREFLSEPVLVTFPDDDDPVVYIAAGLHNNMAITKDGALYCWGQGTQGELGVPDVEVTTPKMIVRREGGSWEAVSVACGGQHTLGLFRKRQK
ncbi:regulator of chromosome condensation 1/beta-lactamase-inhibitor protein II [Roridomyces roridus]|uniref:Regulator of chromosome condensation 1/beta-lactamase-inhibitor protein II n=1 Tax=Roridomyces roridus TaxID=1738132 RepID=A0AAD7C593_9AGAR|nr:regulator of chromosome condensation 1/beta-lactamase-inhibitor protein II [Roridomyces roridus]